jgi:phage protein U
MAVVGTLGRKIVFEVSDDKALLMQSMTREIKSRWTTHETFGSKPKAEFLGADNQSVSLSIYLSSNLGIKPRKVLDAIAAMVESGTAERLVIGGRPVGNRPFRITGSSEAWNKIYSRGELAKATVSITLEEYT